MRLSRNAFLSVAVVLLSVAVGVLAQGSPGRDPLTRKPPTWFDEAKLGIFIHWSAASIPAFAAVTGRTTSPVTSAEALRSARIRRSGTEGPRPLGKSQHPELYPISMLVEGSAAARYQAEHYPGKPYEWFVEQFRDEVLPGWNPESWADLFARAGARYVVLTTRLDDGFLLWPSAHRNPHKNGWQSTRDVVGDFTRAMRAKGLHPGFYYAGGVDYTFTGLPMNTTAPQPPEALRKMMRYQPGDPIPEQHRAYVNAHWRELAQRYKPDVMWNDYFYPGAKFADFFAERPLDPAFKKEVEDLFRYYLAQVPEGVINNRFDMFWQSTGQIYTDFVTPEYNTDPEGGSGRPKGSTLKWETNRYSRDRVRVQPPGG